MAQCEIVFTDIVIEFLEVAFNNILYARKMYPAESFVKKNIYSTAVHICQHPELTRYMKNVLKTVGGWLTMDSCGVSAINMKFFNKDKRLVEKYVFNITSMDKNSQRQRQDCYYIETEQLLRSLILKTFMAVSYLDPLPEQSTFSIDVDARRWIYMAHCQSSMSQNFPWIMNNDSSSSSSSSQHCHNSLLLPLMDIKNDWLNLEIFVKKIHDKCCK